MSPRFLSPRLVERALRLGFALLVAAIVGYVVLPAVVVAIASLNASAILAFPPDGLSLRWYATALGYRDFQRGLVNSLIVMAIASTLAVAVGAAAALYIDRSGHRLRGLLEAVLVSPMVVPNFTIGLGFLIFAVEVGQARTFGVVVVSHVVLVLPFVLRSIYVSLRNIDRRLERAAATLGARPGRVFLEVTLPMMAPGIFAGWVFAAVLSFNEFTASLFVTARSTKTLPVAMYDYVREYADPTMAALSTLFIVTTVILVVLANRLVGLDRILTMESPR
ncbi:putative spermidine/putrescine transport system permease protein [Tistlia consotensis]|uniref:Putative spermidine/putrescine transport system permease protein n=1 Tax=Tistlia consotensis USBA 355 TaxID=560819 RepID=A0A1Y6BZD7_9PROT|nr:ABC transporter permease [Tistlia consotensis]SMF37313.1 putative spermidine/putrescine transport system permease protein [Tistlia consotensis USBA 355]SNR72676.1 putative spermidine/putrescine transport system permease protein [Tistlia consotensis]